MDIRAGDILEVHVRTLAEAVTAGARYPTEDGPYAIAVMSVAAKAGIITCENLYVLTVDVDGSEQIIGTAGGWPFNLELLEALLAMLRPLESTRATARAPVPLYLHLDAEA